MKKITIIDDKIDNPKEVESHLENLNLDINWQILDLVPDEEVENADILFIHTNNEGASKFIDEHCDTFNDIYVTSTIPSQTQLEKIKNCKKVKLFDLSVRNEKTWKTFNWSFAISRWKEGEDFPIKLLKRNLNEHLRALFILCRGYLAIHGLEGWEEVKAIFHDGKKLLLEKKELTKKSEWWKIVFKERKYIEDELDEVGKEVVLNEIDKEKMKTFIDAIYNGEQIKVDDVKDAYETIKKCLGK